MKQFFGSSQRGSLQEATQGLRDPQLILLMSNPRQFEQHVQELEKLFPQVPSIGCIGMSYSTQVIESGVGVVAYNGVTAAANVLEQVSTMPVKYIQRLQQDVKNISASGQNTVCIDFCSGNDACALTTIYTVLKPLRMSLVGGTGDGGRVSANGRIYEDAVAYALVKNNQGKVKAYKENIYHKMGDYQFIASRTDRARYIIGALNGQPARDVYQKILHVSEQEILTQTFKNPFGKVNGNALACYRQVNDSDVLHLLELGDYRAIAKDTVQKIQSDFPRISAVFSVNCLFRYKLYTQNNYMRDYLREMGRLNGHAGLVGYGEHFNNQFVNQSMSCVVFE